ALSKPSDSILGTRTPRRPSGSMRVSTAAGRRGTIIASFSELSRHKRLCRGGRSEHHNRERAKECLKCRVKPKCICHSTTGRPRTEYDGKRRWRPATDLMKAAPGRTSPNQPGECGERAMPGSWALSRHIVKT